jgi:predicted lipoprotein with Yx(FWY)xxD motif
MRTLFVMVGAVLALSLGSAPDARAGLENEPYPGAVALSQEASGRWVYKSFPSSLPLYTFEGDPLGKSKCDKVCIAVWPIIRAKASDKPTGEWTPIKREDGNWQWAYKGKPVYTYFEDTPNNPIGIGKEEGWYLEDTAYLTKSWTFDDTPVLARSNVSTGSVKKTAKKKKPTWQPLVP